MSPHTVTEIKKGTPMIFTYGEYSDYGIFDHAVALRDFVFEEVAREFKSEREAAKPEGPPQAKEVWDYHRMHREVFRDWLRTRGFIGDQKIVEVHLGAYGSFDPDAR